MERSWKSSILGYLRVVSYLIGLFIILYALIQTRAVNTGPAKDVAVVNRPDVIVRNTEVDPVPVKLPFGTYDAFGRVRVSEPFTMFDSSFRFSDNGLWVNSTSGATSSEFYQGAMLLTVDGSLGTYLYRQTTRVFAYQPGKSLLVLSTMAFATPKSGLRQRMGYFSSTNGIYLEQDGLDLYLVLRSSSLGTTTRVPQSSWNANTFLTSPRVLHIDRTNIFWMDIEWLGVGDVQCGFIVDGSYVLAHTFHNDNINVMPYMETGSLPLTIEIENTAATGTTSTFTHICNTVISEGGYRLNGTQISVGTPVTTATTSSGVAGTFIPVVSLRLKTTKLNAIVVPTALSLVGLGNNVTWKYELRANCTVTGGSWAEVTADSAVEYNLGGTAVSGGRVIASGYLRSDNQSSTVLTVLKEDLFRNQLERDPFTGTPYVTALCMAASATSQSCFAAVDWEEVTR